MPLLGKTFTLEAFVKKDVAATSTEGERCPA
jgi:hypothetical protein